MTPTFTDDEYRRIMRMTFLGEWMLNAIRKDPEAADTDALSKLYSFTRGTPLEELVAFDDEGSLWTAAEKFEDEAHALIDQYDDVTFWEELTARITERDLLAEHGERGLNGMRPAEREREAAHIAKAYTHEFEEKGIDRLHVDESQP